MATSKEEHDQRAEKEQIMALSKVTASKIIEVIAADVECRRAIQPNPSLASLNPVTSLLLEFTHIAGSVRNISLVLKSIVEKKNPKTTLK
ncbi:MAG: hypothetical protein IPJ30_21505 [Acidobacteria bacterium]|nr:hypothetical protein [Acidobacteriota bacterium]